MKGKNGSAASTHNPLQALVQDSLADDGATRKKHGKLSHRKSFKSHDHFQDSKTAASAAPLTLPPAARARGQGSGRHCPHAASTPEWCVACAPVVLLGPPLLSSQADVKSHDKRAQQLASTRGSPCASVLPASHPSRAIQQTVCSRSATGCNRQGQDHPTTDH